MTEFGIGTYIRNVVRTLARLDRESQYFLIGLPAKVDECGPLPPNFQAVPLADRIAAEHVEIATGEPEKLARRIRNAGAIFLGKHTPEVIGDYVAGSNHVLPTARSARFSSGLGVLDFMKRTSILRLDERALEALAPAAMTLARAEGLEAHRRSVAIRVGAGDKKA